MSTTFLFLCITFCGLCIFIHIFMHILCFLYFYSFQTLLFHFAEFQILMKNACFRRFFNCLSSSGNLASPRSILFRNSQSCRTKASIASINTQLHPFHTPKHAACGSIDNPWEKRCISDANNPWAIQDLKMMPLRSPNCFSSLRNYST